MDTQRKPKYGEEQVVLSLRLDKGTYAKLRAVADRDYRSIAAEVRRLVETHVEDVELDQEPEVA